MIGRQKLWDKVRPLVQKPVIKVFTGIRRSGKSTLLALAAQEISIHFPQIAQTTINFESLEWEFLQDYKTLHQWILEKHPKGKAALFLDEIQECAGWEKAVNSLFASGRFDLYLTGSNSNMLSSELATKLSGRYIEIPVFTLSFSEFLQFRATTQNKEGQKIGIEKSELLEEFNLYLKVGGFPGLHHVGVENASEYLAGIFNTVLLRDVVERHNIRDVRLLERILRFCFEHVGSLISAKSISDVLQSQKLTTAPKTVLQYLGFLESCYGIHMVPRFDLIGKKQLEFNEKCYLGDIGLRYGFPGLANGNISGLLENVVYLELLRRGYQVLVGAKAGHKGLQEVDFVATAKNGDKLYLQVCYLLDSEKTAEREFEALIPIPDQYPKLVLSLDPLDQPNRQGVVWQHLVYWLLHP